MEALGTGLAVIPLIETVAKLQDLKWDIKDAPEEVRFQRTRLDWLLASIDSIRSSEIANGDRFPISHLLDECDIQAKAVYTVLHKLAIGFAVDGRRGQLLRPLVAIKAVRKLKQIKTGLDRLEKTQTSLHLQLLASHCHTDGEKRDDVATQVLDKVNEGLYRILHGQTQALHQMVLELQANQALQYQPIAPSSHVATFREETKPGPCQAHCLDGLFGEMESQSSEGAQSISGSQIACHGMIFRDLATVVDEMPMAITDEVALAVVEPLANVETLQASYSKSMSRSQTSLSEDKVEVSTYQCSHPQTCEPTGPGDKLKRCVTNRWKKGFDIINLGSLVIFARTVDQHAWLPRTQIDQEYIFTEQLGHMRMVFVPAPQVLWLLRSRTVSLEVLSRSSQAWWRGIFISRPRVRLPSWIGLILLNPTRL